MIKKHFQRPRPALKGLSTRLMNVRGKEIDCSWPSGDSLQGAIFSFFIALNMPDLLEKVPFGNLILALFTIQVCFARVYF